MIVESGSDQLRRGVAVVERTGSGVFGAIGGGFLEDGETLLASEECVKETVDRRFFDTEQAQGRCRRVVGGKYGGGRHACEVEYWNGVDVVEKKLQLRSGMTWRRGPSMGNPSKSP